MVNLEFSSRLAAPAPEVWAHASSMEGVNAELGPWLRMSHPAHLADLRAAPVTPGKPVFQSWILALGLIPIDRHALSFERLLPGEGFDERSASWTQKVWIHRRRVSAIGSKGCVVVDQLGFTPRMGFMAPLLKPFVSALFRHRHQRLRKLFGELA